ncbi:MAG: ferrous iron transport protein B [Clostridia bacterium]|nr:ferrous iron transport protein B [Clostridia bacterium]
MAIKIALAGNPNCGKTTMFNDLTGSNQYVGNWPGVTVEKKEGKLKGTDDVIVQDLPGIYSLSPYTMEEVVSRSYLVTEKPDAILNIVDATNIERNLYLTTQLAELGIPMIIALNMIDITRKNGDVIDLRKLGAALGCEVVETSALKGTGSQDVIKKAAELARQGGHRKAPHVFAGSVEHALAHIEDLITHQDGQEDIHHHHADGSTHKGAIVEEHLARWYAIKLFERDAKVQEELNLPKGIIDAIEAVIAECEAEMDDDAESIITNQRYHYIGELVAASVKKGKPKGALTISDKIDRVVTNRFLALPIFVAVMWLVYTISIGTIGDWTVGFMNDTLFGEWIKPGAAAWLEGIGCAAWMVSLIVDGIIGGVGAVLGFVPQMLILFLLLSLLEDCGYMSRIAFIMDRLFCKFGLSGKSFIPMLVATGCGVPGIMASRTIEQERDRRMTIMTTGFIPCGAKMPIVGMIAAALFGGSAWVATSAYFVGVAAVVVSGLILKKFKMFAGKPAPFVLELPAYHMPLPSNVLRTTWDRGWGFIKRAGTVIVAASVIVWVLNSLSFENGFHYITEEAGGASILELIGGAIAVIFQPLGFGNWQSAVATVLGLVAKEEVVGVFGSLSSMADADLAFELVDAADAAGLSVIGMELFNGSRLAGYSFMVFNLLCAPCFAAMGAIKREMNNGKWTAFAISYMCAFAYAISLIVYQLGSLFSGAGFGIGTVAALVVLAALIYLLVRKNPYHENAVKSVKA